MKPNIYCVFDTETIGVDKKWVYDLGMVIIGKTGRALYKKRWIIDEVINLPNIEKMAFYGNKIKKFYNKEEAVKFAFAREEFREIMEHFQVNVITAYNLQFDMSAIKQTLEFTEIGKKFLNAPIDYFDLWNASCNSFFQQKQFKAMAEKYNWVSEAGNYRTSAEIAYRFITKNPNFVEEHMALEDAVIESKILQEICRQKKGYQKNQIIHMPWRKVQ